MSVLLSVSFCKQFPNVCKGGKGNICCNVFSQPLLVLKAISMFIFITYHFCLSFPFLLIWKGVDVYHGRQWNASCSPAEQRELFVVMEKTHKVNTVFLDYGQGNGCFSQNKLQLCNKKLVCACTVFPNGFLVIFGTVARYILVRQRHRGRRK